MGFHQSPGFNGYMSIVWTDIFIGLLWLRKNKLRKYGRPCTIVMFIVRWFKNKTTSCSSLRKEDITRGCCKLFAIIDRLLSVLTKIAVYFMGYLGKNL